MAPRILLKIGGRAFERDDGLRELAGAIKGYGSLEVIIVHGGGDEVSRALADANRKTAFVDGIRVTPAEDITIVEEVLSGRVNKRIARVLMENDLPCRRMSGKTGGLLTVEPLTRNGRDLGRVGRIIRVNPKPVLDCFADGKVPVVSPISADEKGETYNVNADSVAAALASASGCTDLVYFTDVPGVRVGEAVRPVLTTREAKRLIAEGTIRGGMVAKIESAFEALAGRVKRVHITRWGGEESLADIIEGGGTEGTAIQLET